MPPPSGRPESVRFDRFELDLRTGELLEKGRRQQLQPKVFELLVALLERPGKIVTRDELRARLWSADTFVGFDDSMNHAVRKLRECLGDSADSPRLVETIPRRGYRFIGQVAGPSSVRTEAASPPSEGPARDAAVDSRGAAAGLAAVDDGQSAAGDSLTGTGAARPLL